MLDWPSPMQLDYKNTLNVTHNADFARVQERLRKAFNSHCGKHRDGTPWSCRVHDHYFTPTYPFQGIWMASRAQLDFFMAHPYWKKENVLSADILYGYPERTTFAYIVMNVRAGHQSSCMVPFVSNDNEGEVREVSLPLVAEVELCVPAATTAIRRPIRLLSVWM